MTISGDGITSGNTATTSGTASGVQPQQAGPVLVLSGQRITVTETGSGTGTPKYDSRWSCVDRNTGNSLGSGNGSSGAFTVPDGGAKGVSALCTFTNNARQPAVTLEKTADRTTLVAGQTVTYSFRVTNTGNVPFTGISVSETAFTGSGTVSAISCPAGALAPNASATCTATYVVQQADVDRGTVDNTATATGTTAENGNVTSSPSSVRITGTQAPGITLVKSSDTSELVAGETVTFSFVVTNSGNVTLTNVGVTETAFTGAGTVSAISCPANRTLAPGAQMVCSATYVVQQADVDAESIQNTATATDTPPGGGSVTSEPSTVTTPSVPEPSISVVKTADKTTLVAGETVTYTFRATNTGNVTLTDATVTEGAFSGSGTAPVVECPADNTLSPGEFMDCTATYVVLQADVDRGSVVNDATATGTPPRGEDVTSDRSEVTINADQAPAIGIVKTADKTTLVVGETITYTFTATNMGNVTLTDVALTCPEGRTLAPGASLACTATYVVQQGDVDRGSVVNDATATGTPPNEGDPVTSEPSEATVEATQAPAISVVKTADKTTLVVGETVTYTFTATNTGNVTLTDVTVTEGSFSGSGTLSELTCPEGRTLAPGVSLACTATYVVQQADVDRGSVVNDATATGTPPNDGDPVTSEPSEVTIAVDQAPAISIVKTADKENLVAGETVTYTFTATNTGNVTLTDVTVTEGSFSGSGALSELTCPEGRTLAPNESLACTATYVVQQADVDRGSVVNDATATGTPPNDGDPVTSEPSEATVEADQAPAISIVKTADKTTLVAGETVTYTFTATNTGNVTLTDVTVTEGSFSGSGTLSELTCPEGRTLAPGESLACTATYVVQQADLDRGSVVNDATATGTPPDDGDPVTSEPSEVTISVEQAPAISVVKTADKDTLVVGETVTYTFTATNTGNVTLTDVTVTEGSFSGSGTLSELTCPEGRTLAPGESLACTATYVVQQGDVDRGTIVNDATATGTPPNDGDPVTSEPSEVTVTAEQEPGISVVKTADKENLVVGETVTYTFVATNTGNVTLADVTVTEGSFSGSGTLSELTCPANRTLAPGASLECTATYVVQQGDVDRGTIVNDATATGTPPNDGDPITSEPSEVTVTAEQTPGISIVKSSDKDDLVLGETMTYSFVVTNTGNVTLTDVTVVEGEFTGAGELSAVECPADRTLAPGAQLICTATYVVQQADIDQGRIENTATSTGVPPSGEEIESEPSTTSTDANPAPALAIVKTADKTDLVVGETVTYTFTVTNTGNVTISDAQVIEGEFSGAGTLSAVECPADRTLIPGQQLVCSATCVVQQADVDAGVLTNDATASGNPPSGEPVVTEPSEAVIEGTSAPALALVKTADKQVVRVGDTVTYSFTVTNSGNVTITDVRIVEVNFTGAGTLSGPTCPDAARSLAPGETVVCTATYVVQQADEGKGTLENTATAGGTPPGGERVVSPPSTATTTILTIVLPPTGGELAVGAIVFSVLLALTGVGLMAITRRRREQLSEV